jgi:hypothetical protein
MTHKRHRLLLAATLLFVASSACRAPEKPREVQLLASSTLADLTTGAVAQACSRIYEPPDWAPDRIAEDHKELSAGVEAAMRELGTLSDARIIHKWAFYELQITGADPQYWLALPNMGIATQVTYAVNFSKIGPGILSLSFTHLSGKWELRSISLGVEPWVPDARDKAARIGRALFRAMAPETSDEQIEHLVGQGISPAHN